jgi:SAM-dependent methyltransferase
MSPLVGLEDALGIGSAWGGRALARAVTREGKPLRVVALAEGIARALEHAGHVSLLTRIENGRLPLDDAATDALCLSGFPEVDDPTRVVRECARVVRPGGRVLLATPAGLARRGPDRHLVTAVLLHAGLVDLEQRAQRSIVITSGRVRR